jgi:hypothetical protein
VEISAVPIGSATPSPKPDESALPKTPSEQEISLRKKLRLTCEFFAALNLTTGLHDAANAGQDSNFLPPETVAAIAAYCRDHDLTNTDLVAIRSAPGRWTRSNPYGWLWMLHRYRNARR